MKVDETFRPSRRAVAEAQQVDDSLWRERRAFHDVKHACMHVRAHEEEGRRSARREGHRWAEPYSMEPNGNGTSLPLLPGERLLPDPTPFGNRDSKGDEGAGGGGGGARIPPGCAFADVPGGREIRSRPVARNDNRATLLRTLSRHLSSSIG